MPAWPSKNPDDYGARGGLLRSGPRAGAPYLPLVTCGAVGGAVAVGVCAAIGGLDGTQLLFAFTGAAWVSRSQFERWWHSRRATRGPSLLPASIFAATAVLAGFIIAAAVVTPHHRGVAIYLALTTAWLGGDTLEWVLRRRPPQPA